MLDQTFIILSLLGVFLAVIMESTRSSNNLKREAVFEPEHRTLLPGQSFLNISGISAVRCSAQCLNHRQCVSFNYDRINRICQLNNASREQPTDFFHREDYSYYALKNISTSIIETGSEKFDATTEPNEPTSIASTTLQQSTIGPIADPCASKLGLEDGSIPDGSITASSSWNAEGGYTDVSTPADGRLNKVSTHADIIGAWHPLVANADQWIQVDLDGPTYVTGVLMQGRENHWNQWVTKYRVQYRPSSTSSLLDVRDEFGVTQVFDGNVDPTGTVESRFDEPIVATLVRIIPVQWQGTIALRFELLGCKPV